MRLSRRIVDSEPTPDEMMAAAGLHLDDPEGWGAPGMDAYDEDDSGATPWALHELSPAIVSSAPRTWYDSVMSSTSYLDRFLDPVTEALTPEVARTLVSLRPDTEIQARIETLREKANVGTLTPEEDAEYKEFVEAVDILSIIQSKARKSLAKRSA